MTNLAINDETYARLKQLAEAQQTSTDNLVEQAIHAFLRAQARRLMRRESEAFRTMHSALLEKYPGQFIAIHRGQLVDHDTDQLALFMRIEQQLPEQVVLIVQVVSDIEEVYTVRSPRFEREMV